MGGVLLCLFIIKDKHKIKPHTGNFHSISNQYQGLPTFEEKSSCLVSTLKNFAILMAEHLNMILNTTRPFDASIFSQNFSWDKLVPQL